MDRYSIQSNNYPQLSAFLKFIVLTEMTCRSKCTTHILPTGARHLRVDKHIYVYIYYISNRVLQKMLSASPICEFDSRTLKSKDVARRDFSLGG